MRYLTVFEITNNPIQWELPAVGLVFIAVGFALIKIGRNWPAHRRVKPVGWGLVVFGLLFTCLTWYGTHSYYRKSTEAYRTGNYFVIEGVVEDFHPMPYEGHEDECFRVRNQRFCYSDFIIQPGFHQSASHGGPIREGLPVCIAYYDGQILRLAIRADSIPSKTERSAYAAAQEARWLQKNETDPLLDHMDLGFLFACVMIALCWNLDWQHYIRYWIRRVPPYSRLWELGFRIFLLASLIGSAYELVRRILAKSRSMEDYRQAFLDSLIWIGFFAVFDTFFRWEMSRRKKKDATDQAFH
jgi:hypothetical protein